MDHSVEQRIQIVKTYWENKCAMAATIQKLEEIFGAEGIAVPESDQIRLLVATFLETGSIRDEELFSSEEEEAEDEAEAEVDEDSDESVEAENIDFVGKQANVHHTESEDADR